MCIEKCNMKKGSVTVIASQDCLERLQLSMSKHAVIWLLMSVVFVV